MKKRILVSIFLLGFLSNCVLFNTLGIAPGRIKGSEAKAKIESAALLISYVVYSAIYSGTEYEGAIGLASYLETILTSTFVDLDEGGYYVESEVNKCVSAIQGFPGLFYSPSYVALINSNCALEKDKSIMDSPFPEL